MLPPIPGSWRETMPEHKSVEVKCYSLLIEAITRKGRKPITTAIGGLRNDGGRGHPQGPFKLYDGGAPSVQRICIQKGDKSARIWQVSVDNVEAGEFPMFHAVESIDIRKTRKITFIISE